MPSNSPLAIKQLDELPDEVVTRISKVLTALADNPRPDGVKKLKGQEGSRIRIGEYWANYSIFDTVLLVEVGPRGNFYGE